MVNIAEMTKTFFQAMIDDTRRILQTVYKNIVQLYFPVSHRLVYLFRGTGALNLLSNFVHGTV